MILFYDTETTGLPDFKSRSDDPKQPHLVQLAMTMNDDDGSEVRHTNVIVRPDGWTISPEIAAIHGITTERAMDEGVPEGDAVALFILASAASSLRVAHNENFDCRILRIAMMRAGIARDVIEFFEARANFCTCNSSKHIVNLPPTERMLKVGMTTPKPPKLEECMQHFFREGLAGAHDALVDVRACARIYFHLQAMKVTP